jgi:GntR family galactonate operon transcriptional repressor
MEQSASTTELLEAAGALPEPRRLGQQLAPLLASEIVSGRIGVGQGFPSAEEIVTRFHVSRTVARETVQTLALVGLVRVQHGKRTEVLPPEEWEILSSVVQEALRREGKAELFVRDAYEFRLLIEPKAAAWMARDGTEEDHAQLAELAGAIELLAESRSNERVLAVDREFHNLIARASGNRVLAAVSRDIRELLKTLWELSRPGVEECVHIAEQHRRIADAITRRDPEESALAMHEHLVWASQADLGRSGPPPHRRR